MVGNYYFIFVRLSVFEIVFYFHFFKEIFLQAKYFRIVLVYTTSVHAHKGQSHSPNVHNEVDGTWQHEYP